MQSPVALQAQSFRSCLCADEMDAPIVGPSRDDLSGGPILHAVKCSVKARSVPSARSVVVPQDEIHDVCLAVAQLDQTHPKQYARVAVLGCTARSAVARAHGVMWLGALPAAPFCGALPACAGACVAGRQPLHVGACPRFALHTAHTRRGIVRAARRSPRRSPSPSRKFVPAGISAMN
jgi:hypothetical protein